MKNTPTSRRSTPDLPLLSGRQDEYLRYLGFRRNPFPVAPDVEHLFLPPRMDTLLTEILHGIYTRKGFMVITGEVGLGKTTLSQHILNILEEEGSVETALVLNTFLQGSELLDEIIRDFDIQTDASTHQGRLAVLNQFLIERYQTGNNCAVIIDDAQNLSLESLELIRMISNLETDASKLVQILLVGQPEFQEKLDTHALRQLKSRIMIHATVEPLDQDALRQYVFFKMSAAGGSGGITVPENCFGLMHQLTDGNPRLVNRLMDRTLYGLFAYNTTRVSRQLLTEVAMEIGLSVPTVEWRHRVIRSTIGAFAIMGLVSVLLAGKQLLTDNTDPVKADNPPTEIAYSEPTPPAQPMAKADLPEPAEIPPAPPEIQQFLAYYGLESHLEDFTKALETGLGELEQRVWQESGYRLIQLPEQTEAVKGGYRVLRQVSADGIVKRLLFWQPNYWIDSFSPGDRGEPILALQKQLALIHFYHADPDGIVGKQTITSLIGFQKRYNLPATGQPDATTLFFLSQIAGDLQWGIQVASLQRKEDASALMYSLSRKGFKSFVKPLPSGSGPAWQVVRIGPLASYADAKTQQLNILTQLNLTGRIIQFSSTEQETTRKG